MFCALRITDNGARAARKLFILRRLIMRLRNANEQYPMGMTAHYIWRNKGTKGILYAAMMFYAPAKC